MHLFSSCVYVCMCVHLFYYQTHINITNVPRVHFRVCPPCVFEYLQCSVSLSLSRYVYVCVDGNCFFVPAEKKFFNYTPIFVHYINALVRRNRNLFNAREATIRKTAARDMFGAQLNRTRTGKKISRQLSTPLSPYVRVRTKTDLLKTVRDF